MSCRNWECGVVLPAPERRTVSGAAAAAAGVDELFGGHVPIPMTMPAEAFTSKAPEAQPWFFSG